jgi:predicted unusual protein kinase regulating ubiquinone biosynthesis (AarF/ABC1/UbiB family)
MAEPAKKELPRETISRRQLEIERCFAAHGLMPRRRRLLRDVSVVHDDGRYQRLRAALVQLGPVFSLLGIYLSSRADLLPAMDCLTLAEMPDKAAASPAHAIRELIAKELPSQSFAAFDEAPFESRLIFQSHRARLFSGETVTLKVVHPELEEHLSTELELLSLISKALPDLFLDSAIEDFRHTLKQQTDFVSVAVVMAELYRNAPALEVRRVPLAHRELCTSRVLTFEHIPGWKLDDLIDNQAAVHKDIDFSKLAGQLSQIWLQQSLQGGTFAVDPRPENILVAHGQQIVFTNGSFASLPPDIKTDLYDYLIAVVSHDPDRACSYLLREMKRRKGAVSEDELRHRIRQVVPFRDGGWTSNGDSPGLAEYLFVHWRLAHECGYRPQPPALFFFRGLFQVATTARQLAPAGDPLFQGLQDLRMEVVFAQFREMMTLNELSDQVDKYAAMMADFPQRLNDALTLVAEGHPRPKYENTEKTEFRSQKNSPAIVVGLLFLLIAVVLLSRHVSAWTGTSVGVDSAGAVIFLMIGALLMRVACRA